MKIIHVYPATCEYAYPKYLNPKLDPDQFDLEIMCNTDLEVRYLKGLQELGVDCTLLYPRRFNVAVKSFTHRGGYRLVRFPVSFFKGKIGKEYSLLMLKYIRKEKPDLVHYHGIFGGGKLWPIRFFNIVALFCKINKIPFFGWYHVGGMSPGRIENILRNIPVVKNVMFFLKSWPIKIVSGITSINHVGLKRLFDPRHPEYYGYDFSKIPYKLTSNTFNPKFFYPVERDKAIRKAGLDPKKRYIIIVSRLFEQKGLHYLINVLPQLIKKFPNVHLLVIGEFLEEAEDYKKYIYKTINELNIGEYVTFLGRIEHHQGLLYYLNASEVFILPTYMDSFAAVNIEAMACGVPVISTRQGEIPYYLKPGVGILVPEHDENELCKAIDKVLSGTFKYNWEEQKSILAQYDYLNAAKSLKTWYEKILDQKL